jgi:putative flippase GtrA
MSGISFFKSDRYRLLVQLLKFLLAGLPSFLVAVPINWLLVEKVALYKPVAYMITLLIQVTVNFFILRKFVFIKDEADNVFKLFLKFLWGIAIFRLLDWGVYTIMVKYTTIHYLIVQLSNVVIFSVLKFLYSRSIMDK